MIGLLINAVFFLIPLVLYAATGCTDLTIGLTVVAGLYTIGNGIVQGSAMYDQIADIEKIEENTGKKAIYVQQRDGLVAQATLYLGEKFPEHEKEIFRLIAEKNGEAMVNVLAAMPEIKSAGALKDLVNTIKTLHENVYEQDLRIEKLKRQIRVRSRNPWLLQRVIPSYSEQEVKHDS